MAAYDTEVPVLVVGGSLVGLSTSLFLAKHGVEHLVVERHPGTAIHPRAGHFHLRTIEVMRAVGLEEQVRKRAAEQYDPNGGINNVESLAGTEISHFIPDLNAGVDQFSPTVGEKLPRLPVQHVERGIAVAGDILRVRPTDQRHIHSRIMSIARPSTW